MRTSAVPVHTSSIKEREYQAGSTYVIKWRGCKGVPSRRMSAPTFVINEKVMCFHGPFIYEAKVLKVETKAEQNTQTGLPRPHYFVHYQGWKKKWDEWIPANRILKFNETSIARQKELRFVSHKTAAVKAAPTTEVTTSGGRGGEGPEVRRRKELRGHKRGREEDEAIRRPEMKLDVPNVLKMILVDDWEAVTKNNKLVTVPRAPNVHELLQMFRHYCEGLKQRPAHIEALPIIVAGLQLYFDRSLGANLLYLAERTQYARIRKRYVTGPTVKVGEEKNMSVVYGAEHLLRMIVNLPAMISVSDMDQESANVLRYYVHELMDFMIKFRERLFQCEYESASTHSLALP